MEGPTQSNIPVVGLIGDLIGLLCIAGGLAGIHFGVPTHVRANYIFVHSEPSLITIWTSAFVHQSTSHLLGNLIGYAIAILPAWLLAVAQDNRRRFWMCVVGILLLFPIPLAIATDLGFTHLVAGITAQSSLGFSGLVGAFAGLLFGFLTWYFVTRHSGQPALIGTLLVVLSLLTVLIQYHRPSGLLWIKGLLGGSIALGCGVLFVDLRSRSEGEDSGIRSWLWNHGPAAGLILGGWVALAALTILLFPRPDSVAGVPNIIVHGVGLGGGYTFTLIVHGGVLLHTESIESIRRNTVGFSGENDGRKPGQVLRESVTIGLTQSIVPERLPQSRLPVETQQAFVRPVLRHYLQFDYDPAIGPLEVQMTLQPTPESEHNQSVSGTISLLSSEEDWQSVSIPIADTYLSTTFVPRSRVLNPKTEQKIANQGSFSMPTTPDGTIRTRPSGSPDHFDYQTYTWLRASDETEFETSSSPVQPREHRRLPSTEYVLTVQIQKPMVNQDYLQQFQLSLSDQPRVSSPQLWIPEWEKYQPLPILFRTIMSRYCRDI
ncbi:rhomboid family protein [Halorussus salinus]|uniref:hypothetical protein n=1 Tax=Halorussus salinus TaxID=1364935 RepID=UPI00109271E5|nr:hypothetical protein [Halorussus salinus]